MQPWHGSPPIRCRARVVGYLARNNLPAQAAMGWRRAGASTGQARRCCRCAGDAPEGSDAVSITGAFAGIAETGTLVMAWPRSPCDPQPAADTHVVVLCGDIVGGYEDVWARLRARYGRTACRAPSTRSPARHARETSSRPSSSARTDRDACTSWSCANERRRRRTARPAAGRIARRRHQRHPRDRAVARSDRQTSGKRAPRILGSDRAPSRRTATSAIGAPWWQSASAAHTLRRHRPGRPQRRPGRRCCPKLC